MVKFHQIWSHCRQTRFCEIVFACDHHYNYFESMTKSVGELSSHFLRRLLFVPNGWLLSNVWADCEVETKLDNLTQDGTIVRNWTQKLKQWTINKWWLTWKCSKQWTRLPTQVPTYAGTYLCTRVTKCMIGRRYIPTFAPTYLQMMYTIQKRLWIYFAVVGNKKGLFFCWFWSLHVSRGPKSIRKRETFLP